MGGVMDGDNAQYECLRRALLEKSSLSVDIKGFAVVADDAFINWRHLADHDLANLGTFKSDPVRQFFSLEHPDQDCGPICSLWAKLIPYGFQAANATYNELQQLDLDSDGHSWATPYVKAMSAFQKMFTWNPCDLFYLPAKLSGGPVV